MSTSTHQEQEFWHCQNEECGNYYQEEMDSCPLCKQERGRGAARSHLWVPRPSLEGPHVQERPEPGIGLEDRVVDRLQVQNVLGGLDPRYAQVLGLYAKGYESNEIAQRLGIPTEEAPRWLRDAKNAFVELWHAEEIARLTEEGYSEADIAGELGVPKSKVRDALKRARLKLADPQSREGSVQR